MGRPSAVESWSETAPVRALWSGRATARARVRGSGRVMARASVRVTVTVPATDRDRACHRCRLGHGRCRRPVRSNRPSHQPRRALPSAPRRPRGPRDRRERGRPFAEFRSYAQPPPHQRCRRLRKGPSHTYPANRSTIPTDRGVSDDRSPRLGDGRGSVRGYRPGPRAGDGNRTRTTSLEGWSSTIELHPRGGSVASRWAPSGYGANQANGAGERFRSTQNETKATASAHPAHVGSRHSRAG